MDYVILDWILYLSGWGRVRWGGNLLYKGHYGTIDKIGIQTDKKYCINAKFPEFGNCTVAIQ